MKRVRLFLSSPGDVRDERNLARKVVEQLNSERAFVGTVVVEIVAYDQPGAGVAMEAALTPQAAIDRGMAKPQDCDIVVGILWSRLGTPLSPEEYPAEDGSGYRSGTEWELKTALASARANTSPSVWIYRRTEVPNPDFDDPDYDEKRHQWQAVEDFFAEFEGKGGVLAGGINSYKSPGEFRTQFEQHLRDRLTEIAQSIAPSPAAIETEPSQPPTPEWHGNPYPGLEPYSYEQSAVFFGRDLETDGLIKAVSRADPHFVCVVGGSGSGKSSLVRAGLIPRLMGGALPGSECWRPIVFKPGERGGNPFLAFAYPLKRVLGIQGLSEEDLASEIEAAPGAVGTRVLTSLEGSKDVRGLLLVVDQFEEAFPRRSATEPEEMRSEVFSRFTAALASAARTEAVRVVATLRSDFYEQAIDDESLCKLLPGDGTFTLHAPGVAAMYDMVTRPARAAGKDITQELAQRLVDDTGSSPGGLALLGFALYELYRAGGARNVIDLDCYRTEVGGVEGAIKRRADAALGAKGERADRTIAELFEPLVEIDQRDVATRRRAPLAEIQKEGGEVARLLDALINARLLVVPEDTDPPQVEVAHEAVFSAWPRLQRWIQADAANLRLLRSLENAAADWEEIGCPALSQLPDRSTLKRYRTVESRATARAHRYYKAGWRRQYLWSGGIAIALVVLSVLGVQNWLSAREFTWTTLAIWVQAKVGMYKGPPMVALDRGEFTMGCQDSDCSDEELPTRQVTVPPFKMGRFEVTFDDYGAYVLDTGQEQPDDRDWGAGSRPVINVSWDEIEGYIKWLNGVTGGGFRLPTEAEWEYAARAGTTGAYWWGEEIQENGDVWANCNDCGSEWDGKRTAPVGSFPANQFGLHDTAGNVWEWVEDCWHDNYGGAPVDGSAWLEAGGGDCGRHVLRGGSWSNAPYGLRSALRSSYFRDGRSDNIGFRLAQSARVWSRAASFKDETGVTRGCP